jgi:dihydrofolate reductase
MQVTYYAAASEDGFIARPDGALDWLPPIDPAQDYGYAAFLATVDGVVMGRSTWRTLRSFGGSWPYGPRPGWVISRDAALEGDAPANVQASAFDLPRLCQVWAARGLRRIWLVGGGQTAGAFLRAEAIDELILTTVPVRLREGVPLFGADNPLGCTLEGWAELGAQRRWPNGLTQRTWRRA